MALTLAGRRLTDAHRIAQVQLAREAAAAALVVWDGMSLPEVTEARDEWLALQVSLVRVFDGRSAALAVDYLDQFRTIEGFPGGPLLGTDGFDLPRVRLSSELTGPVRMLTKIRDGMLPVEAKAAVRPSVAGTTQRFAQTGGRRVVDESALANTRSVGWRRVSDGDPCGFCALLASRGPRYKSEGSARGGRKFHDFCGCSVEEVFGEWKPTAAEERHDEAYTAAAAALKADGQKITGTAVLAKMREAGYR